MRKAQMLDEGVRIAFDAVRTNKLRSALTILGVAVGVMVVVTMAALITGIRSEIMEAFDVAGPDNFTVMPFDFTAVRLSDNRPPWWDKPPISAQEVDAIGGLPGVSEAVVSFDFSASLSHDGDEISRVDSRGTSSGWPRYTLGQFSAGRNFTASEARRSRAVVVLSAPLALDLFGPRDPIGQDIRVVSPRSGVSERFSVIGVYEFQENIFSGFVEHIAFFPYRSAIKRLNALDNRSNFLAVGVVPTDGVPTEDAEDQVISVMRSSRGLGPTEDNNFAIARSDQIAEQFDQLTAMFFMVMLGLSSVGLMVGGIGVVGIMMISVTERTREIGIRKSVGASRGEILWQFLVEAGVLTLLGGAAGMMLGATAAYTVAHFTPIPASIPLWSVVAALTMAVITGMLFGLFPAYRASRLSPVKALGYE